MLKNIKRKINKVKEDKEDICNEIEISDNNENIDNNEKQVLDEIKTNSEIQYKNTIKSNMIEYVKNKNNENINYEEWLREFNILDWEQEFNYETEKRENKIYHTIWDNLITNDDFVIIY